MVMSKKLRLVRRVVYMEKLTIAYRTLVGKPEGEKPPLKF
jgi:hypothetical protein